MIVAANLLSDFDTLMSIKNNVCQVSYIEIVSIYCILYNASPIFRQTICQTLTPFIESAYTYKLEENESFLRQPWTWT